MTGGTTGPIDLCATQLFREKNIRVMVPLVSLTKGLVLVGRGASSFRRRNRHIGSDHRQAADVTSWQGRRGPSGVSSPRAGVCERERRAELPLFHAAVMGLLGPIRSKWSCSKRRRSRAEPFRTCSSRAGLGGLAAEGVGAQSTARLSGRSGPSASWFRVFGGANSTPTADRNWVPAGVTSRLCTRQGSQ